MISRTEKLGDICRMRTGKLNSNAAVPDGAFPFFTCAQETYRINEPAFDTEAVLLGGNNANGVFPLKYYKGQFNAYQRTYVIEPIKPNEISTRYLYYALRPALSHFEIASIGAATQYLTKGILDNFKLKVPEYDRQERIADILSAYDDLIENNRRRIELLERAARELYREWFVRLRFPGHEHTKITDNLPEGWAKKPLGDFAKIRKGRNITKDTIEEGNIPVVAGGINPAYFHSTWNAEAPVITVSASGANAGYVNLYLVNIWASDSSYISSSENPFIYFIYCAMKYRQTEISAMQRGAAQPHVYPKDISRLLIEIPGNSLIQEFNEAVSKNFQLIRTLDTQSVQLRNARDLLLPRLMNGTISV